ncbi:hypothetical protein CXB51_004456 [Gossypium anomalum]|uniref:Aluminum-activated malate transporter n=1 Tax=Gossypium anomalum TaxID=47600 RepID=A0A8J5ZZD7_9ROSI|nr:hypothetical protein CXB51_004456 [Gossypium anomalum]
MDLESPTCHQEKEKQGQFGRGWSWIKAFPENVKTKVFEFVSKLKKLGQDDPRKVIHSLKVGLAIGLIIILLSAAVRQLWRLCNICCHNCLIYTYVHSWATLGKGVIRGLATLLAGALAVGAHHLANLSGCIGDPIGLGFFVFLQCKLKSFDKILIHNFAFSMGYNICIRLCLQWQLGYDYGLLIFTLTFVSISVSGYQDDEILELAYKRLSTILSGSFTCIIVSIMVFPVWAGEDLHILIASNMEKLGSFLEGFADEYFEMADSKQDKSILQGY